MTYSPVDNDKIINSIKTELAGNVYMTMVSSGNLSQQDKEGLALQLSGIVTDIVLDKMGVQLDEQTLSEIDKAVKSDMLKVVEDMTQDLSNSTVLAYSKHGIDKGTSFDDALMELNEKGINLPNEAIMSANFMGEQSAQTATIQTLDSIVQKVAITGEVMQKMQEMEKPKDVEKDVKGKFTEKFAKENINPNKGHGRGG